MLPRHGEDPGISATLFMFDKTDTACDSMSVFGRVFAVASCCCLHGPILQAASFKVQTRVAWAQNDPKASTNQRP